MNVLDLVGNTPIIELKKIFASANGVSLFAKAEYFNPSGSVKDRAAKAMILQGINSGQLTNRQTPAKKEKNLFTLTARKL